MPTPTTRILSGHQGRITGLCAVGSHLFSASLDGTLRRWDPHTGQCLQTLCGHTEGINTLTHTPGGPLISGGREGWVVLWDPITGERLKTLDLEVGSIRRLALCPDKQRLILAGSHPVLLLVDLESGDPYHTLRGHQEEVHALALSPGGSLLASGGDDSAVLVWDLFTYERLHRLPAGTIVHSLCFSPDGQLLAAGGDDYTIKLWDWRSGILLEICLEHQNWIRALTFSPEGHILASAADDYQIGIRHMPTGQSLGHLRDPLARPCSLTFWGDHLVSGNFRGDITLWENLLTPALASGSVLANIFHPP